MGHCAGPGQCARAARHPDLYLLLSSLHGAGWGVLRGPLQVCSYPELAYINHRQQRSPGEPAGFAARRWCRRRLLHCSPLKPTPVSRSA